MSATQPAAAPAVLEIRNPATGELAGRVPVASPEEVAAAAARARAAQPEWAARGFAARARILARFHDLLLDRAEPPGGVLDTIQSETGKARRDALAEVFTLAGTARHYLAHGAAALAPGRRHAALPGVTTARVIRKPHGLVGFVTPWNYPLLLSLGDAVPALLAGNAVLLKPSELTPLSAVLGAALLAESGLPEDLLALVHGGADVGREVVETVDYLAFTGSVATGRKIGAAAAARLIPFSLELGGKNPMLVLADAPLEEATAGLLTGAFTNSGQTCIAVHRVYVEEPLFGAFVRRAGERAAAMRVGWSRGWDVDMGSLIGPAQAATVRGQIAGAVARGAQIIAGGAGGDLGPAFVAPTLLTGVPEDDPLAREETFGPVAAIFPVKDAEEAIRRANDSAYGLNAAVWSGSRRRAREVARRLEVGSAGVNSTLLIYNSFDAPMGGVKASGLGRRHGAEGIVRFTQSEAIVESPAAGGGYEAFIPRMTSPARARMLLRAARLWRRIPGLR